MPRIQWVEDHEATGLAAEVYAAWKARNPGRPHMPGILKCFSPRPDFLRQVIDFSNTVHFSNGHLNRRIKEMIATYVSGINGCLY